MILGGDPVNVKSTTAKLLDPSGVSGYVNMGEEISKDLFDAARDFGKSLLER